MSVVFRSREILPSDALGSFNFGLGQTSNCAGRPVGCRQDANAGFEVASFLLGYATRVARSYIGEVPHTEKRPEWAAYVQDDFRATSRLTLNLGLRWDLFVPWVEVDDRQSNFDPTTGRFVLASEDAAIAGVHVGRYLQTYSKKDFGPRFGFAYDRAAAAGRSSAAASACSGTGAPEGRRPPRRRTSRSAGPSRRSKP